MRIMVVTVLLALGGCVSESAVLHDQEGHTVNCSNWGFGLIGAPVAMASQSSCVKDAQAKGYTK